MRMLACVCGAFQVHAFDDAFRVIGKCYSNAVVFTFQRHRKLTGFGKSFNASRAVIDKNIIQTLGCKFNGYRRCIRMKIEPDAGRIIIPFCGVTFENHIHLPLCKAAEMNA